MKTIKDGIEVPFQIMNDEMVAIGRQLYLLDDKDLKGKVIGEAHESKLMVHPGSTKMYCDL